MAADSLAFADTLTADAAPMDSLEQLIGDTPMPKAADELFDDFVFNFSASRRLQMSRIVFPLTVRKGEKVEQLEKKQWTMEHFFMRQGYYTLFFDTDEQMQLMKDTSVNHAIVEKIFLRKNLVKQWVFSRVRGAWMLHEICEMPIESHLQSSFLNFYYRFVTDSAFQRQSLDKTVAFTGPDPDDDFAVMEGVITPDTWEAFAPTMPSKTLWNIIYGQPKAEGQEKILILRGIANGQEMEMRFRRLAGKWKLVKLST